MARITVFYGMQVYGTYNDWRAKADGVYSIPFEIREGCYIHSPDNNPGVTWYRGDGTPCLDEDVPKTTRTLALLLSL